MNISDFGTAYLKGSDPLGKMSSNDFGFASSGENGLSDAFASNLTTDFSNPDGFSFGYASSGAQTALGKGDSFSGAGTVNVRWNPGGSPLISTNLANSFGHGDDAATSAGSNSTISNGTGSQSIANNTSASAKDGKSTATVGSEVAHTTQDGSSALATNTSVAAGNGSSSANTGFAAQTTNPNGAANGASQTTTSAGNGHSTSSATNYADIIEKISSHFHKYTA